MKDLKSHIKKVLKEETILKDTFEFFKTLLKLT